MCVINISPEALSPAHIVAVHNNNPTFSDERRRDVRQTISFNKELNVVSYPANVLNLRVSFLAVSKLICF